MKIIIPKKNISIFIPQMGEFKFKKNYSYIMSDIVAMQLQHMFKLKKLKFEKYNKLLDINEYYTKLNVNENGKPPAGVIIIRTGGIGDLLALSSITKYIYDNITKNIIQITSPKYPEIFNWYKAPVKGLTFFDPVEKVDYIKLKTKSRFKSVYFEGVIENSRDNWYELQFKVIGIDSEFKPEYGRPQIKDAYPNEKSKNINFGKKTILINPKSTSRIRTTSVKDIYTAILEVIKDDSNWEILIHENNIPSAKDRTFIEELKQKDKRFRIIKAANLKEFFLDARDSTLTVTVDTAIVHFREGLEKRGVAIYAPFSIESRTKYYKHVNSVFIKYDKCDKQPCFIHTKKPHEHCYIANDFLRKKEWDIEDFAYAPCVYSKSNEKYIEQLSEAIKSTLE